MLRDMPIRLFKTAKNLSNQTNTDYEAASWKVLFSPKVLPLSHTTQGSPETSWSQWENTVLDGKAPIFVTGGRCLEAGPVTR